MENVNRELVQAWLNLQCSMVAGVTHAAVLLGSRAAATWPEGGVVSAPVMMAASARPIDT